MNLESSWLYRRDLVAIGRQSGERLAKGSGGLMFRVVRLQTVKGGLGPSSPSMRLAQSPGTQIGEHSCMYTLCT